MLLPPPIRFAAIMSLNLQNCRYSICVDGILICSFFFQDKNWEVVETSRNRVDQFKRTMPLVGDLKNPAMRPRHWEKIQVRNFQNLGLK